MQPETFKELDPSSPLGKVAAAWAKVAQLIMKGDQKQAEDAAWIARARTALYMAELHGEPLPGPPHYGLAEGKPLEPLQSSAMFFALLIERLAAGGQEDDWPVLTLRDLAKQAMAIHLGEA